MSPAKMSEKGRTPRIKLSCQQTLVSPEHLCKLSNISCHRCQQCHQQKNLKKGEPLEINCLVIKSLNFNFNCFCVNFQILHVTSVTSVASKMDMKKNYALIYFLMSLVSPGPGKKNQKKEENLELTFLVIKSVNFNFT